MEGGLLSSQLVVILPVGLVVILAVLVFAFGFKSSVEPPSFKHISSSPDDRKNTKKKRVKEKKLQTNGHATVVIDVPEAKKAEPVKPLKQANKVETPKQKKNADADKVQDKKPETQKSPSKKEKKSGKENVESKNKKNAQKAANEKPADYDEGEWEIAPSRKDKKSKKKEDLDAAPLPVYTPEKNSKKKTATGTKRDEKLTVVEAKVMETIRIEDILPQAELISLGAVVPTIVESATVTVATPEAAAPTVPAPATELAPTPVDPTPVVVSEVGNEEQSAKKKKVKKAKTSLNDEAVVAVAEPVAATPPEPVKESPQVFNELEDAWKEAPQKKSKKKVRKD